MDQQLAIMNLLLVRTVQFVEELRRSRRSINRASSSSTNVWLRPAFSG